MNLNISDRDKKIILALFIVIVLFLPYVFYVKDTRIKTDNLKVENENLSKHLVELQEMDKNRSFYLAEIDRLNTESDAMVAGFPADIKPENYTMFLLNTEYRSKKKNPVTGQEELEYPILFDNVSFGINSPVIISAEGAEEELTGITNLSTVSYRTYYEGMKDFLKYMLQAETRAALGYENSAYPREKEYPFAIKAITMNLQDPDFENGEKLLIGTMSIEQYAIAGGDRVLEDVVIDPDLDENGLRGTLDDGIFGPRWDVKETAEFVEAVEGEEGVEGIEGVEGAEGVAGAEGVETGAGPVPGNAAQNGAAGDASPNAVAGN